MKNTLIGLVGAKGSGKSTTANALAVNRNVTRVSFAAPIRDMLRVLGLTDAHFNEDKEAPTDLLLGKTPRHAMQTLGTEWRDMIDRGLWLRVADQKIDELFDLGRGVVIDDVRFPHEVDLIRERGGVVWTVRWPSVERLNDYHTSELHWRTIEPDQVLINDGTSDQLARNALRLFDEFMERNEE